MSTHMARFQSFSAFLYQFLLGKLATSSIRVKPALGQSPSRSILTWMKYIDILPLPETTCPLFIHLFLSSMAHGKHLKYLVFTERQVLFPVLVKVSNVCVHFLFLSVAPNVCIKCWCYFLSVVTNGCAECAL